MAGCAWRVGVEERKGDACGEVRFTRGVAGRDGDSGVGGADGGGDLVLDGPELSVGGHFDVVSEVELAELP